MDMRCWYYLWLSKYLDEQLSICNWLSSRIHNSVANTTNQTHERGKRTKMHESTVVRCVRGSSVRWRERDGENEEKQKKRIHVDKQMQAIWSSVLLFPLFRLQLKGQSLNVECERCVGCSCSLYLARNQISNDLYDRNWISCSGQEPQHHTRCVLLINIYKTARTPRTDALTLTHNAHTSTHVMRTIWNETVAL